MIKYFISSENFLIEEKISEIKKSFNISSKSDLNYLEPNNIKDLKEFLNYQSFFSTNKLVLLKNFEFEELIDVLESIKDLEDVLVIIYGEMDKRSKLYNFLKKGKFIEDIKVYDKKSLMNWIVEIGKKYNTKITLSNASKILDLTGEENMFNIQQEVLKLIFVREPITPELIKEVVTQSLLVTSFDFTDALFTRDISKALKIISLLKEDNLIPLLALVNKNLCILQSLSTLNSENFKDLGVNPFMLKKVRSFKNYNKEDLSHLIELCQQLDFDLKNSVDSKLVIDQLIFAFQ